jgi:predicted RNase H-like nuclease (RuvC/YqgF family)
MDHELVTYLEQQFGEIRQRFADVERRFEKVDEQIRHLHILVEEGRAETRLLAEGMMGFSAVQERAEKDFNLKLDDLRSLVTPLCHRLDERVTRLEERERQKNRDVMDLICERFGTKTGNA